jgi:tetratricopeptide (TPR) repeat protein
MRNRVWWCSTPVVFLVALSFYLLRLAWFTYPNEFTPTLAALAGLDPFRPMSHPLWQLAISALIRIPGASPSVAAAVLSALCGAASVSLVFAVTHGFRLQSSGSRQRQAQFDEDTAGSRRVGALAAAAYATVSLPVLIVSTRPHPLALGAFLLMAALWLTRSYQLLPARRTWYAFAGIYGLGCAEFPTFFLAAPFFGLWWTWLLWRNRPAPWRSLVAGLPLFALAYSLAFVACWRYFTSPVAEWRAFDSFGRVIQFFLLEQYTALLFSVPRHGWILISLMMIAPALIFFRSRREEVEDRYPSVASLAVRSVVIGIALISLFEGPGSPWRLTGAAGLVVTPYLVTALWFGWLIAVIHFQLGQFSPPRRGHPSLWKKFGQPAMPALTAAVLLLAGWQHARMADVKHARALVRFADDVLASLGKRTWLLTDGSFDSLLNLRARDKGIELHLLNRGRGRSASYLRYVASLLPDAERRSAAGAGLQPMLDVWFSHGNAAAELAAFDDPGLWLRHGFDFCPEGLVSIGAPNARNIDSDAVFARTVEVLAPHTNFFASRRSPPPVEAWFYRRASRHLSLAANNLGVLMEDAGRTNEAWRSYEMALVFDRNNASALFNLQAAAVRQGRGQIMALKEQTAGLARGRRPSIARMIAEGGFIRNPSAYAQQGMEWAAVGKSEPAADRIRQAMSLANTNAALQTLLAQMLQASGAPLESAQVYRDILRENPVHPVALAGLMRIDLAAGRYDEASALLDRLQDNAGDKHAYAVERAMIVAARGDRKQARALLLEAAQADASRPQIWLALALMSVEDKDEEQTLAAARALEGAVHYAPGQIFLADYALSKGDSTTARDCLKRAADLDRRNPGVLERLAMLDFVEGRMDDARARASDLLNLDGGNATANYVLGMVHYHDGKRDLAEAALRRSLDTRESAPACHGLAWLLLEQEKHGEALEYARRAVALAPGQAAFHGTLGLALARAGNSQDGAASFDQALNLGLRNTDALLAAADTFLQTGQTGKVVKLFNYLERQRSFFSASASNQYTQIKFKLDGIR